MTTAPSDAPPPTTNLTPQNGRGGQGFLRSAAVVSVFTFASRLLGLVRDRVLGSAFGIHSPWLAAFFVGFTVPNLFRRLFGEGALTAAFVPHYARLVETNPALAQRFASRCVAGLAVLLAAVTLIGEAGLLFALRGVESGKTSAALEMTALMLPYMPLVCCVAFLGAILQVHHRFGPAAAAPVILNVATIGAALWAGLRYGTNAGNTRGGVVIIALAVLAAGLIQLAWLALAVRRTAPLTREGLAKHDDVSTPMRAMLRTMVPMVIGLGVFQINTLFDQLIAYSFAAPALSPNAALHLPGLAPRPYPIQTGGIIALGFAQRLYQFPLGVFGIALATAIFPVLARTAAACPANAPAPSDSEFTRTLRRGLRLAFMIGLPASAGLMLLAVPTCRVIFETGQFTSSAAFFTAAVLVGYASGVWAYTLTHVLTRGFYALDDAKTPLKISLSLVGFNLMLNLAFIWPLGVAGLAWSTAISATLQVFFLTRALGRRVQTPLNTEVLRSWATTAALTALMAAGLWLLVQTFPPATLNRTQCAALLATGITASVAFFALGAWLLKMPEIHWLRKRG
ncbi:MAG: murein biosynthesis integral membrane protein MurJ [Algisphaera sp.]